MIQRRNCLIHHNVRNNITFWYNTCIIFPDCNKKQAIFLRCKSLRYIYIYIYTYIYMKCVGLLKCGQNIFANALRMMNIAWPVIAHLGLLSRQPLLGTLYCRTPILTKHNMPRTISYVFLSVSEVTLNDMGNRDRYQTTTKSERCPYFLEWTMISRTQQLWYEFSLHSLHSNLLG